METCSLEDIERLILWFELQFVLVLGVVIKTGMGRGQTSRGRGQPLHQLTVADHGDVSFSKCCLHLLTQVANNLTAFSDNLLPSRQRVLSRLLCFSF